MISTQQAFDAPTFLTIAKQVCESSTNIEISSISVIGKWIRSCPVERIRELDNGGYIERITDKGGKLASLLVRALMETQHGEAKIIAKA